MIMYVRMQIIIIFLFTQRNTLFLFFFFLNLFMESKKAENSEKKSR